MSVNHPCLFQSFDLAAGHPQEFPKHVAVVFPDVAVLPERYGGSRQSLPESTRTRFRLPSTPLLSPPVPPPSTACLGKTPAIAGDRFRSGPALAIPYRPEPRPIAAFPSKPAALASGSTPQSVRPTPLRCAADPIALRTPRPPPTPDRSSRCGAAPTARRPIRQSQCNGLHTAHGYTLCGTAQASRLPRRCGLRPFTW